MIIQVVNCFLTAAAGGGSPYGSHIGWRLEIDANNGHASTTALSSLIFKDQGGSTLATTGGTSFSAGSGSDGVGADHTKAFDANSATTWNRTSATNTKIGYIYAAPQAVATIDMVGSGTATANAKTCRLQYSDDTTTGSDGTWTTAFEIWEPSWVASGQSTRTWPQDLTTKWKALRIRMTANNGDRFVVFNEIEFRSTVSGADQASSGCSFATDVAGLDVAANAYDNSNATHYDFDTAGAALPQSIGYFLPASISIAEYMIYSNSSNGRIPRDFKLQGSNDGATWTDLNTQTGISGTIPFTGTYAV